MTLRRSRLLVSFALVGLAGCAAHHMPLSPELAQGESYSVQTGSKHVFKSETELRFGPYQAVSISKGETRSIVARKEKMYSSWSKRAYSFSLMGIAKDSGGTPLASVCSTSVDRKDGSGLLSSVIREPEYEISLRCMMTGKNDSDTWMLDLRENEKSAGKMTGRFFQTIKAGADSSQKDSTQSPSKSKSYQVSGSHAISDSRWLAPTQSGFEFRDDKQACAAVERLGKGRVVFSPALTPEDRKPIAAAGAALLLYQDLNPNLIDQVRKLQNEATY